MARQYKPRSKSVIDNLLGFPPGHLRVSDQQLRRIIQSDDSRPPRNHNGGERRSAKTQRYPARHEHKRISASQRNRCPVAA